MPVGPVLLINTMFNDILYEVMVVGPTDPVDPVWYKLQLMGEAMDEMLT